VDNDLGEEPIAGAIKKKIETSGLGFDCFAASEEQSSAPIAASSAGGLVLV